MSSDLRVVQLGENIGARIDGVRLGAVDAETAAAINQALVAHKVIFFRGQNHLDDDSHYAVRRKPGRSHDAASDAEVRRQPGDATGVHRRRRRQPVAHRCHVRRPPAESVNPARRRTAALRRHDHLGLHCCRLSTAPAATEGSRGKSVGRAQQRLRLRPDRSGQAGGGGGGPRGDPEIRVAIPLDSLRDAAPGGPGASRIGREVTAARHPSPSLSSGSTSPNSSRCTAYSRIGSHGWRTPFDGTGNSATSRSGTTARPSTTPCPTSAISVALCTASRWPATSR